MTKLNAKLTKFDANDYKRTYLRIKITSKNETKENEKAGKLKQLTLTEH